MHTGVSRHRVYNRHRLLCTASMIVLGGLILLTAGHLALSHDGFRGVLYAFVKGTPETLPAGQWAPLQGTVPDQDLSPDQQASIERLLSLGYTAGTEIKSDFSGITAIDDQRASRGLRFFISGHAPRAVLMDRDGGIVHAWSFAYEDVYESLPGAFLPPVSATACWRRARLLPGGDLLAIYEGHALIRLDRESRLIWSYAGKCHHDLDLDEAGNIYVLTREAGILPRLHPDEPVLLDFVTRLDPDGHFLGKIPLLEAFENSPYADWLPAPPVAGDIFHTNSLELLDGRLADRSPAFRAGNILISVRELDMIAVLDPRAETIVWAARDDWSRQHEPTVLANGHLLLFDNQGCEGRSRVVEFDPVSMDIVWQYANSPETPLYSKTCGAARRLANGHTLIVESDNGRVLEVTDGRRIVWEYYNPYRAGEQRELIAAILDMEILPDDQMTLWLHDSPTGIDFHTP